MKPPSSRILLSLLWIAVFLASPCLAQTLTSIQLSPASPARLLPGQEVTVTFVHSDLAAPGARIFVRPRTSGQPTPGYAATGSPLYPAGNGQGTSSFSIRTGTRTTVDAVRFEVLAEAEGRPAFAVDLPVDFVVEPAPGVGTAPTGPGLFLPATRVLARPHLTLRQDVKDRLIPLAPVIPGKTGPGSQVFYSTVPALRPPDLPPEANATLSDQFTAWLEDLNQVLLAEIRLVVPDPGAVDKLLGVEAGQGPFVRSSMRLFYLKLTQVARTGGQ